MWIPHPVDFQTFETYCFDRIPVSVNTVFYTAEIVFHRSWLKGKYNQSIECLSANILENNEKKTLPEYKNSTYKTMVALY